MSLSDLSAVGSFVSGLAVLASLVFLFFQMRQMIEQVKQSERNQQAQIRQVRSTRTVDIVLSGMEPSVSEAHGKAVAGGADISDTALRQFALYWRASFYSWEDAFYQHEEGLFTESAFNTLMVNIRSIVRLLGIRTQWRLQRENYGPEFVAWMDRLVAQSPIVEQVDPLARWREGVAAERSGAAY